MKAMLSVVVIVALIRAASSAGIHYYSAEKLQELPIFDPHAQVVTATIINPGITRSLRRAASEDEEDKVSLNVEPIPDQENGNHAICKGSLGIDISNDGGSPFCELDVITVRLRVTEHQSCKFFMILELGFGFETENNPMMLEIPVFSLPPQFESPDQEEQLKKWIADNRLATVSSPFTMGQLFDLLDFHEVSTDFNWLEKLVSLGIHKSPLPMILENEGKQVQIETYVLRPLIMSHIVLEKLVELVQDAQDDSTRTLQSIEFSSQGR